MDKNEQINMLLQLRKCNKYSPAAFITLINGYKEGDSKQLYLEVKHRIHWFLQWCEDEKHNGRIDESNVQFDSELKMIIATCKIFVDEKEVATGCAGVKYDPENQTISNTIIQEVCTSAKGRALANYGFGTAMTGIKENGNPPPCDAGIPIADVDENQELPFDDDDGANQESQQSTEKELPEQQPPEEKPPRTRKGRKTESASTKQKQVPKEQKDKTPAPPESDDISSEAKYTEEQIQAARECVYPYGSFKGCKLGDMLTNPLGRKSIVRIATEYTGSNDALKNSAAILKETVLNQ